MDAHQELLRTHQALITCDCSQAQVFKFTGRATVGHDEDTEGACKPINITSACAKSARLSRLGQPEEAKAISHALASADSARIGVTDNADSTD